MDIRMPDGTLVTGVPDTVTAEELEALKQNYQPTGSIKAPTSMMKSFTGILPDIGGMGGAAGGAILGAQLGSVVPGIGTIAGGIMGSAIGAFSGAGAGESLRQLVEGESADGLQAIAVASREGMLDVTGSKAFDILAGAGKYALSKFGYGEVDVPAKEVLQNLQAKLAREGTTLRASQINPNSAIIDGIEAAGEVAIGGRQGFKAIREGQIRYIDNQIEEITKVSPKLQGQSLGHMIQNLIDNTRTASDQTFRGMFEELEQRGLSIKTDITDIRNMAQSWKKDKAKGFTKRVQEQIKKGKRIPFTASSVQATVDDILTLSPKSDFATSFEKLKALKSKLTAMKGDPATRGDPAVRELTALVKGFEKRLLTAAKKTDPDIGKTYENLMKEYNETQELLYSDVAKSILDQGNPELLGKYLTQAGTVTPVQELRKIIQLAKKKDVEMGGKIIKGVKKGFLNRHLGAAKGEGVVKLEQFRKKLADEDFVRTYEELFSPAERQRHYQLIEELEILNRGVGGELALSVRSAQVAGATGAAKGQSIIANTIKAITPAKLAEAASDPKRAQQMLGLMKQIQYANKTNKPLSPQVIRGIGLLLGETGREMYQQGADADRQVVRQRQQAELEAMRQRMMGR
jgi:hypothetical protein